jgi:trigger factor
MIVAAATVKDEKVEKKAGDEEDEFAVYHSVLATKEEDVIPQAKYEDNTPKAAEKEKESDR